MNIPTWEESRQAVMIGYADAIHGFISEYEPANIDESEIFRNDLQVLVDDLIESEAKNCAEHYHRIMRYAVEQARAYERYKCAQDYLQDCADAVEAARLEEREVCAKLCDDWAQYGAPIANACARSIRQRGEK